MKICNVFVALFLATLFWGCTPSEINEEPVFHTITFDANGGTEIAPQMVEDGDLAARPEDPEQEGSTFINWFEGNKLYDFSAPVHQSLTLSAQWTGNTYTVSFDTDGAEEIEAQVIDAGDFVTEPPVPAKYGYTFEGWKSNDELFDFSTPVIADLQLVADWAREQIDLTDKSPWISEVLDFRPAPGQFINKVDDELAAAKENLVGDSHQFVSLGTFGGNVSFKFDHPIVNREGNDLAIYGNSFEGNSEPGIVMVCQDLNGNGQPDADEPWYELAGSDYDLPETTHNYEITYYRPEAGQDTHIIPYKEIIDGQEKVGTRDFTDIKPFHDQPMFPAMYTEGSVTFKGTLLKSKTYDQNEGTGSEYPFYVSPKFDWGYADNAGYEQERGSVLAGADVFDLSNAVDAMGNKVTLIQVDFVKVYTATTEIAGWLGELSPEITKAADLSMLEQE